MKKVDLEANDEITEEIRGLQIYHRILLKSF